MPRKATIRIILAVLVGFALWFPATAAQADDPCCSMSMSGLPGTFTAGADPLLFNGTINVTAAGPLQSLRTITARFGIQAPDLSGSQVHFSWRLQSSNGNWHSPGFSRRNGLLQTTFYPYQNFQNAGQVNIVMRLSFGDKVKSQHLQIGMDLLGSARKSDAKVLAHTGPFASSVVAKGGAIQPPPTANPTPVTPTETPTAPATDPGTAAAVPGDTSTPDNTGALPGVTPANTDASSSGVWVLYIIGGLLLVGGIGVIGTLLWKRSGGTSEWVDPNDPSLYGDQNQAYPGQAYPDQTYPAQTYPTQTYPAQTYPGPAYPPANYPQPGANPQAAPGGRPPIDPTRQMPKL
jgi:hypothetical protein